MRIIRLSSQFASCKLQQKSVITIGNFDGMHLGHQLLLNKTLEFAKNNALNSGILSFEPHPREYFAPNSAPARLSTLREKLETLQNLNFNFAAVCRFNQDLANLSSEDFVKNILVNKLQVQHIFIGDDFVFGKNRLGNFSILQQLGKVYDFTVSNLPSVKSDGVRISSSLIRETLQSGNMQLAAKYLGDYYSIDGNVKFGRQLGRQLGFPTANLNVKHSPLPLTGVYAVEIIRANSTINLFGVANLGIRPTLNSQRPLLEVHIFNFNENIYGEHLKIKFCYKIRDEMKFPDLNTLRTQIAQDVDSAHRFFSQHI